MEKIKIGYIVLFILGYSMIGLVSYSIFTGISNESNYEKTSFAIELPPVDCRGIVVDSEGFIFCGIQRYNQVYVYDKNGKLIRGFDIDGLGGTFKLRMSKDDHLEVATVRNNKLYTFDKNGNLLRTENISYNYYSAFGAYNEYQYNEYQYIDKNNIIYQIKHSFFTPPQIIKVTASNHQDKLISTDVISAIEPREVLGLVLLIIGIIYLHWRFKTSK